MRSCMLILVACLALAAAARGELTVVEQTSDRGTLSIYKLTVTPAAEPTPALKHRLTLRETDYMPGNAATHYLRAFPEGGLEATWRAVQQEYGLDEVHSWYSVSRAMKDVPQDKARLAAARFDSIIRHFVEPASDRIDCDWGHDIVREMRVTEFYSFLLPEIQSMRSLSRALMLTARVAIADKKYDRAIDLMRMNYRLGVNVAQSPFLVSGLVGIACCGMGNSMAIELIGAPDSPNLYWAIAELPRPLVSVRGAMRNEFALSERIFSGKDDPETARHSPEQWGEILAESLREWAPLSSGPQPNAFGSRIAVTTLGLVMYPDAKQRLIEGGMDREHVETMPVGQVLAIDAKREFRRIADGLEKWLYVPYESGKRRYRNSEHIAFAGDKFAGGLGKMLASLLLPAVSAARGAELRLAWQLDAIQAVEAIRMHAAETGKLPASLDEVTVVPVPRNPITEKPFEYRLDGDAAVLDLPLSDGFNIAYRFEIRLAR